MTSRLHRPSVYLRFLALVVFLVVATPGAAVVAKVSDIGTGSIVSGTSLVITVGASGAQAGNFAIISVAGYGAAVPSGASDSRGNTYASVTGWSSPFGRIEILSSRITTPLQPGDSITVLFPVTATGAASASEFSGLVTTGSLNDVTGTAYGLGTPAVSVTASGPTVQNNELILAVFVIAGAGGADSLVPGAGYTALPAAAAAVGGGSVWTIFPEFRVVSAMGSYTADGLFGADHAWAGLLVTLKDDVAPVELLEFRIQ
jgi:hypothetical protein